MRVLDLTKTWETPQSLSMAAASPAELELSCPVCLDWLGEAVETNCAHAFCCQVPPAPAPRRLPAHTCTPRPCTYMCIYHRGPLAAYGIATVPSRWPQCLLGVLQSAAVDPSAPEQSYAFHRVPQCPSCRAPLATARPAHVCECAPPALHSPYAPPLPSSTHPRRTPPLPPRDATMTRRVSPHSAAGRPGCSEPLGAGHARQCCRRCSAEQHTSRPSCRHGAHADPPRYSSRNTAGAPSVDLYVGKAGRHLPP